MSNKLPENNILNNVGKYTVNVLYEEQKKFTNGKNYHMILYCI